MTLMVTNLVSFLKCIDIIAYKSYMKICLILAMFWAGYNYNVEQGHFTNELTGEILKEEGLWPWLPAEPNGGNLEECACVVAGQNGWNDFVCSERARGFCNILPNPRLILRGRIENNIKMYSYSNVIHLS